MAEIKPFRGYLPPPDLAKKVSCLPYDVLSSDEARLITKKNRDSFLRVIKPETDYEPRNEPEKEALHHHAAENLAGFIRSSSLIQDDDPRTNKRIDFVGGIRGLEELEHRCSLDSKIAFALYPITINELLDVADEGKVMPPKSTWFEPKLRSGLIVRLLD